MKAVLMYSADDTTVAIGEHIGGTHDDFIDLMNEKALELGAKNKILSLLILTGIQCQIIILQHMIYL